MKEALYYETEGGKCRCVLCPHRCLISDGAAGLCRVRAAEGGRLYATSYGAATSLSLDPIEKKPLYGFHPGACILSYGSYGCNMRCAWCQNSAISQCETPPAAVRVTPEELARQARESAAAERGNIGVAFTYNEPLIAPEFILDTAPLLHKDGLLAVLVTNGIINEAPFADILPHIDAMNIDLKSFSKEFYEKYGARLETVMANIEAAAAAPTCHVEVTTLVIPGGNDSDDEMERESAWLAGIDPGIPLHITRYFPRWKMRDREPTPVETLDRLAAIAGRHLAHVHIGNV
jgi:pyruvate formate lyase activating enzyme